MDTDHVDTLARAMGDITRELKTMNAVALEICAILTENQPIYPNQSTGTPMPDVVAYGEWEIPPLAGVWGKGSSWRHIGWLGHFNNFNPKTKAPTSIYHEFTKWLLSLPRNRNFWMTGNSVEYFADGKLIKVAESVFRTTHTDVIKNFFEEFVDLYEERLLMEAKRVLGDKAPFFMQKLNSYMNDIEFTNAKDDAVYSNQICKQSIKQIRYHLREKIDDT